MECSIFCLNIVYSVHKAKFAIFNTFPSFKTINNFNSIPWAQVGVGVRLLEWEGRENEGFPSSLILILDLVQMVLSAAPLWLNINKCSSFRTGQIGEVFFFETSFNSLASNKD